MACGLPGLISAQDGAIDLIRDGENGFLLPKPTDAGDVRKIVNKALSLGENERCRLGLAARHTVQPLTWEAHLSKWLQVIDEVSVDSVT